MSEHRSCDCSGGAPVACDLSVFTPDERVAHFELGRKVFTCARRITERPDGFGFAFDGGAAAETDLARWIEDERRCCPFFRFSLDRACDGSILLELTGPAGAKEVLRDGLHAIGLTLS